MTVGQKASVSFLIAVLLFTALAVAAFSGLFNVIESSFYNPSIVRGLESSLSKVADEETRYHASNLARFGSILTQDAVRKSFLPNISSQDSFNRANALGKLQEETAGLSGLRFIDANGTRIHFSTIPGDIRSKTDVETMYRNYGDTGDLPYNNLSSPEGLEGPRARVDPGGGPLYLYSLPFSDSYGIYRGSAVFQVSMRRPGQSLLVKEGLVPRSGESAISRRGRGWPPAPRPLRPTAPPCPVRVAELWAAGLDDKPVPIASRRADERRVLRPLLQEGRGSGPRGLSSSNASDFSPPRGDEVDTPRLLLRDRLPPRLPHPQPAPGSHDRPLRQDQALPDQPSRRVRRKQVGPRFRPLEARARGAQAQRSRRRYAPASGMCEKTVRPR